MKNPLKELERLSEALKEHVDEKLVPKIVQDYYDTNLHLLPDKLLAARFRLPVLLDKDGKPYDLGALINQHGLKFVIREVYHLAAVVGIKRVKLDDRVALQAFIHWFEEMPFLGVDVNEPRPNRQLYIVGGNYKVDERGIEG